MVGKDIVLGTTNDRIVRGIASYDTLTVSDSRLPRPHHRLIGTHNA